MVDDGYFSFRLLWQARRTDNYIRHVPYGNTPTTTQDITIVRHTDNASDTHSTTCDTKNHARRVPYHNTLT